MSGNKAGYKHHIYWRKIKNQTWKVKNSLKIFFLVQKNKLAIKCPRGRGNGHWAYCKQQNDSHSKNLENEDCHNKSYGPDF